MQRTYDLEDRLVKYAADIVQFTKEFPREYAANKLREQMTRASFSSALNYGEVQAAESTRDFKHKSSVVLKELKECRIGLKLSAHLHYGHRKKRQLLLEETEQLAAIFGSMISNEKLKLHLQLSIEILNENHERLEVIRGLHPLKGRTAPQTRWQPARCRSCNGN